MYVVRVDQPDEDVSYSTWSDEDWSDGTVHCFFGEIIPNKPETVSADISVRYVDDTQAASLLWPDVV